MRYARFVSNPLPAGRHGPVAVEAAVRLGLRRREHHELDAFLDEALHGLHVDCRLGEPDPFAFAFITRPEELPGPADLRELVPPGRERHNHVIVHLRHGVAVPAPGRAALPVRRHDPRRDLRVVLLEPPKERGAEVVIHVQVVVADVNDHAALVEDAREGVGPVALVVDAFVPVVVGRRRTLLFYKIKPRVFARRLVEMAVDDHIPVRGAGPVIMPRPGGPRVCRGGQG